MYLKIIPKIKKTLDNTINFKYIFYRLGSYLNLSSLYYRGFNGTRGLGVQFLPFTFLFSPLTISILFSPVDLTGGV